MNTTIYVLTHKPFTPPTDPIYVPLSVHESSGDHIAVKNDTYSELTGLYWIWKNDVTSDIVGTAHYRRYLLNDNDTLLNATEIEQLLSTHDCITTKALELNYRYYDAFCSHHKPYYLDELRKVLSDLHPDSIALWDRLSQENHTYFSNIMIARKSLYADYCAWLFELLFTLEERIIIDEPDSYHRRIFGFLSEFLWYFWVKKNGLCAYETFVGMNNEKAEIGKIRKNLANYFAQGNYNDAKAYFLKEHSRRPDIMMEASDMTGELHLAMEIIAICEYEASAGHRTLLERLSDWDALMSYTRKLNAYAAATMTSDTKADQSYLSCATGHPTNKPLKQSSEPHNDGHLLYKIRHTLTSDLEKWYQSSEVSEEALYVARQIL